MNELTTLLAKDWREQRFPLAVVFGLGTLAALVCGVLVDSWLLDSEILARVLTFAFGGLAAMALGCDIGARERGEGSLAWALRQPFGLGASVTSKTVVLVGATLGGIALGYAVSQLVTTAFGSGAGDLEGSPGELLAAVAVVSAGLWSAAASSFLPRGFLAAPGGLVVWLLCAAPAWVPIVWWELHPGSPVLGALLFALLAGGLLAFVAGQCLGVRRSDSQVRRAAAVVGAGALGCLPLWIAAAQQTRATLTFDATGTHASVVSAHVAEDGRHLHLTADTGERDWRRRPLGHFPLVLDTETGRLRQVGPAGHHLAPAPLLADGRVAGSLVVGFAHEVLGAVDASGATLELEQLVGTNAEQGAARPEVPRGSIGRLADGGRVELEHGALWRLGPDGGPRERLFPAD